MKFVAQFLFKYPFEANDHDDAVLIVQGALSTLRTAYPDMIISDQTEGNIIYGHPPSSSSGEQSMDHTPERSGEDHQHPL